MNHQTDTIYRAETNVNDFTDEFNYILLKILLIVTTMIVNFPWLIATDKVAVLHNQLRSANEYNDVNREKVYPATNRGNNLCQQLTP